MAKGFNINLTGIQETLNKLDSEKEKYIDAFDFAIATNVQSMAAEAKQRAPVDTGRLRSSISASKVKDLTYDLIAQTKYGAYVEFGTGNYFVSLQEKEWNELAKQFIGKGIKKINLKPRPYLRPSVLRILPILNKDLQDIADKKVEV